MRLLCLWAVRERECPRTRALWLRAVYSRSGRGVWRTWALIPHTLGGCCRRAGSSQDGEHRAAFHHRTLLDNGDVLQ